MSPYQAPEYIPTKELLAQRERRRGSGLTIVLLLALFLVSGGAGYYLADSQWTASVHTLNDASLS